MNDIAEFGKIDLYIPATLKAALEHDANIFEIRKKDGITINRNRFYTLLIKNYYDRFVEEYQAMKARVIEELRASFVPSKEQSELANRILKAVSPAPVPKRKGKHLEKVSLKPTADTLITFQSIRSENNTDDSLSQTLYRMLLSYSEKPQYEREKILFRDSYEVLEKACANHQSVLFSTIWDRMKMHTVVPYKIVTGREEMFHYLIGLEQQQLDGSWKTCSYRLNRLFTPTIRQENIVIPDDLRDRLDRMERYAPQFAINEDTESCVRMTADGQKLYDRIYLGRPKFDHIVEHGDFYDYYFYCSTDQLYLYFRRFPGKDAKLLYPEFLRFRITQFHKDCLESYNNE